MSSDKPKTFKPYADLSDVEYRPSQTLGHLEPQTQQALRVYEDQIFTIRKLLRKLEIPMPPDQSGVSMAEANEIAQTYQQPPACAPTAFTNPTQSATALTSTYATIAQGAYVYMTGDDGANGHFQVYRIGQTNESVLLADLTTTDILIRMCVVGPYAFAVGGSGLTVISITKPNDPAEVAVFSIGTTAKNIDVQGRYAVIAAPGPVVKVIDVAVPAVPVLVSTAS